jgi:pimeloyl-ACP methyl ester carboxylesterase
MTQTARRTSFIFALAALLLTLTATTNAHAQTVTGTFGDGAKYLIEVPAPWNGTLLLYSHGYVTPGSPNPATDVGDPGTRAFLLANGFALAGSSYAHTGWAIQEALLDQVEVLDTFTAMFGKPKRTIAWGHSLGGIITAGLIQRNPKRFNAALPMCGVLSGGVATWNQALDGAFAFKTLFDPSGPLQVVNITSPNTNFVLSEGLLAGAQSTPQGRARLALVAALGDTPGWFNPASPEPAANDFTSQEINQFLWFQNVDFPFIFALRAELEFRAGGNPSWNTSVNYFEQFENSVNKAEVRALYKAAGLNLEDDLETLNHAVRISAHPASVDYLEQNIIFNGDLDMPVLTMHTTGDGLVSNQNETAYRNTVHEAGDRELLRQVFVHRAGHCTFTPAETVTALVNLINRLDSGHWPNLGATTLNGEAALLGPLNVAPPSFIPFESAPFLRPFDTFIDRRCERHGGNEQHCVIDPDGHR